MRNWFRPEHDHKDLAGQNDYTKFRDIDFAAYVTDLTTGRTEQRNRDISTASVAGDYFGCDALVFDGNLDRSVIAAAKETESPAILVAPVLSLPLINNLRLCREETYCRTANEEPLISVSRTPVKAKKNPKRKTPEEEAEPNSQWSQLMRLPWRLKTRLTDSDLLPPAPVQVKP